MNKEIQQEAERRYPKPKINDRLAREFFIEGATFAQQKQDERMIEFAQWASDNGWSFDAIYENVRLWVKSIPNTDDGFKYLTSAELLTIFKAEKGY